MSIAHPFTLGSCVFPSKGLSWLSLLAPHPSSLTTVGWVYGEDTPWGVWGGPCRAVLYFLLPGALHIGLDSPCQAGAPRRLKPSLHTPELQQGGLAELMRGGPSKWKRCFKNFLWGWGCGALAQRACCLGLHPQHQKKKKFSISFQKQAGEYFRLHLTSQPCSGQCRKRTVRQE